MVYPLLGLPAPLVEDRWRKSSLSTAWIARWGIIKFARGCCRRSCGALVRRTLVERSSAADCYVGI